MSSSNQRSPSSHPSRTTLSNTQSQGVRSVSVPHRQFTIILTNNPELLRQTLAHQPMIAQQRQPGTTLQNSANNHATVNTNNSSNNNNNNRIDNNREQLLDNLLQVELRDVAYAYLLRTRRPSNLSYVFDMPDIEL
ncbi:unnamed protein product [Rotaria magnacalcarata]|uniref:Uncharacterized protein n=1 Tax=Rotaria magnacalcarata TaxID=392030 RepID=A0A816TVS0_9BILA|nr:unnamed protein product [Rotaria magnacalcarata]CAF3865846.1 unnamed protein product [Rotaria magnacalcarata]